MKINKKFGLLLLLFVISVNLSLAHPYYVSICRVDFNEQSHALEISVKTFADDLLLGLENCGKKNLFLGEPKEHPNADKFIFDYLKNTLQFTVNNNKLTYTFVGKEMENDVVWSYLEISDVTVLKDVEVRCTLLTEVLSEQKNIIQIHHKGTIKNLLLSKNLTEGKLTLNN